MRNIALHCPYFIFIRVITHKHSRKASRVDASRAATTGVIMSFTFANKMALKQKSAPVQGVVETDSSLPARRTVGRFRETRSVKLMRSLFGTLSTLTPELAAHIGYRVLAKPPSATERHWQRELRQRARTTHLPFAKGRIAVYEWGCGPTVLMVHGWGARATHMGRMIDPLVQQGYRVVAFDAPAHGHSSGTNTDLIEFAGAVHAVAQHAGTIHTLIAHSFGAAMALFAQRDWNVQTQQQIYISSFDHCLWFTEAFGQYIGIKPAVLERMRQMMMKRHNGQFSWEQLSVVEMLRRTTQPTLLIHDQEDGEIPFEHSVALFRAAPYAEMHATCGLGHHRLLGNAEVISRVLRFVAASPVYLD
jgi:pimeloyl-ACP methyl ester carboxylesterase